MSYEIELPGDKIYKDNRIENLKGELSSPNDIDEVFRDLCALNKRGITEMRGLAKADKPPMTLNGLISTCIHFGLIIVIDGSLDFFCVKHAAKGEINIEAERGEEPEPKAERTESKPEQTERFKAVGSEDAVSDEMKMEEEEEDLF